MALRFGEHVELSPDNSASEAFCCRNGRKGSVVYYEGILAKVGTGDNNWIRLFMVPGMGHCAGGNGPTNADWIGTLEKWREQSVVPESIPASGNLNGGPVTRPLCPYPQLATYKGKGDNYRAENFDCKK